MSNEEINVGDRAKVTNKAHAYHDQIGEVQFINGRHVWVKFPSGSGMSVAMLSHDVTKLKDPEKGDRVRVHQAGSRWDQHEGTVESVYGKRVNVTLDEDGSTPAMLHIKEVEVFDPAPVHNRVEGAEILFHEVKKGDTIETLTFKEKNGIKHKIYSEGVVDVIATQNKVLRTREGGELFNSLIHSGIKLIKAVENDTILKGLKDLPVGTIISFYDGAVAIWNLRVAVKKEDAHWGILGSGNGGQTIRTDTLREMLKRNQDTYTILTKGE
jgi:hypothetical protein